MAIHVHRTKDGWRNIMSLLVTATKTNVSRCLLQVDENHTFHFFALVEQENEYFDLIKAARYLIILVGIG